MFPFQRAFRFLPLLIGLSLLFAFGGTAFAAPITSSHQSTVKMSSVQLREALDIPQQAQHPLSITNNCDTGSISYGSHGGVLCAVESYATPCLNVHDPTNWNVITCVAPGTILEMTCQVNIPSHPVGSPPNVNTWWDAGYLPDGRFGEFSDYYMDTVWTNNNGSPALGPCATG